MWRDGWLPRIGDYNNSLPSALLSSQVRPMSGQVGNDSEHLASFIPRPSFFSFSRFLLSSHIPFALSISLFPIYLSTPSHTRDATAFLVLVQIPLPGPSYTVPHLAFGHGGTCCFIDWRPLARKKTMGRVRRLCDLESKCPGTSNQGDWG